MNDVSWNTILLLIARHVAGVIGGWLVHKGYADASAQDAVIGAIMMLAAVGGSWWQKTGQAAALRIAEQLRQNAAADVVYWRGQALRQGAQALDKKPPAPSVAIPMGPPGKIEKTF